MNDANLTLSLVGVSTKDMLDLRKSERSRTLNDYVEDCHIRLWDDEHYREVLDAVYDEQAIEGSLAADNFVAAGLIRDYAKANNVHRVSGQKLASLVKALNIVMRRYGMSRKERARMLGGEVVPSNDEPN